MSILGAFVMPHPPIIMPEVGRGEERKIKKTADSCNLIAEKIAELEPETIVLTSPHSVMYADYFHISPGGAARGDLQKFGAASVLVEALYDAEFVRGLCRRAEQAGMPAGTKGELDSSLDHGTVIPLGFVNGKYTGYKLVRVGLSGLSVSEHYELGMLIAREAESANKKTVILASGDLSHKVSASGPYGFAAEGVKFDREITRAMANGDFLRFLTFPPEFAEKAAECGLRSFIIMAGALDGKDIQSELLSYENTFGVGYAVASFIPCTDNEERRFLKAYEKLEKKRIDGIKTREDEYVRLARNAVYAFVQNKDVSIPVDVSRELLTNRAGVFVSIKKQGGLRGCIGTIEPVNDNIAEEITRNAVSACSRDPRFPPITPGELDKLEFSVDVLTNPEHVGSEAELDVKKFGVIVTTGAKKGVLLPDLEGIDTVGQQISIAKKKAGIREGEKFRLMRFEVVRHR